jgi:hypothetical protein
MAHKWKIFFLAVFSVAFFGHFALVSSYLIKPNPYSLLYSYPFFHQNWNLFVPPPDCNYYLYVYNKDQSPQVIDVFNEILTQHQKNRLKGYEPLLIALSNSIYYFEKEAEAQNFTIGKATKNENYSIMEKIAKSYLKSTKKADTKNSKFILFVKSLTCKKTRIYFN